jgi:hypothetical protein
MSNRCSHIERVSIHPSVKIGGAFVGQCVREALPGLTVCAWHADPETLSKMIMDLYIAHEALRKLYKETLE